MNPATQTPQTTGTMGLLSQLNRVVYRRAAPRREGHYRARRDHPCDSFS